MFYNSQVHYVKLNLLVRIKYRQTPTSINQSLVLKLFKYDAAVHTLVYYHNTTVFLLNSTAGQHCTARRVGRWSWGVWTLGAGTLDQRAGTDVLERQDESFTWCMSACIRCMWGLHKDRSCHKARSEWTLWDNIHRLFKINGISHTVWCSKVWELVGIETRWYGFSCMQSLPKPLSCYTNHVWPSRRRRECWRASWRLEIAMQQESMTLVWKQAQVTGFITRMITHNPQLINRNYGAHK